MWFIDCSVVYLLHCDLFTSVWITYYSDFYLFQCGKWHSVHIDDIHPAPKDIPSVAEMSGKSVSALLDVTKDRPEVDMEIEIDHEDRDIETMETNEEIDLMDIHIEEKAETKKQFEISYLIKKCIQPALGNVKDPKSDETRAVDRLKIILNWMQVEEGIYNLNLK